MFVEDLKRNNLTGIQILAALLVVFSHSYRLGEGMLCPLTRYSLKNISFGTLAVGIFLMLSGFMVAQSFGNVGSSQSLLNRLRLLYVIVIIVVCIVGPIVTKLDVLDYFQSKNTWLYLRTLTLFTYCKSLPGVFETNVFKLSVNGSLWVIPWQMWCYVIMAGVGVIGLIYDKRVVFCLWLISWCLYYDRAEVLNYIRIGGIEHGFRLFAYFMTGWVWFLFVHEIRLKGWVAFACVIALAVFLRTAICDFATGIFGSYVLMWLIFAHPMSLIMKLPPISFGIFVFSFPAQQCLTFYNGGRMDHFHNFLLAVVIVIPLAYLEYVTVERLARVIRNKLLSIGKGK